MTNFDDVTGALRKLSGSGPNADDLVTACKAIGATGVFCKTDLRAAEVLRQAERIVDGRSVRLRLMLWGRR